VAPDGQLLILLALTFVINLVQTLAYSVRIAGVRTGRIAISISLFNVLVVVSRTANTFQSPVLAKRIEQAVMDEAGRGDSAWDFRWLMAAASLATVAGILLTPTFQRLFTRAVAGFAVHRSFPRLLLRALSPAGLAAVRASLTVPRSPPLAALARRPRPPAGVLLSNVVATGVWVVGALAPLYAMHLDPALRVTSSNLSAVVNGVATILLLVVVDPYLSLMTDDVVEGRAGEGALRRSVVWFLGTRLAGTVLAQLLLAPAASTIAALAERI
jgi:hypothetical protein